MAMDFLKDYKTYPRMVHWFNPILLYKLLNNVVTSAMFGQYADRRLIVAALDTVSAEIHIERATGVVRLLPPDDTGAVWIDFVADLGDGFDSTYAVASLLARKELRLEDTVLPRGQLLIMGGDEVYPVANAHTYKNQLFQPYKWAFPDHDRKNDNGVPLFAIPGNHDWYDGLVQFLAYFSRGKPTHFGSWRTQQKRSYFAIQITRTWWIWAMDIQLAEDMDQPQSDYFTLIAASEAMLPGSRIIVCSAEPGWLYGDTNMKSWDIVDFTIGIAHKANKNFTVPILLSGDTHHYSRYEANDGTQFVTSGGGGAFLHPTHHLEEKVNVRWINNRKPLALGKKQPPKVAQADAQAPEKEPEVTPSVAISRDPLWPRIKTAILTRDLRALLAIVWTKDAIKDLPEAHAVYPSMERSRRLLWRNLWFAITNWDFSILMGLIYFVIGLIIGLRDYPDAFILTSGLLGWGIIGYTTTQENVSATQIYRAWRKRLKNPSDFDALANEKLASQFYKLLIVVGTSLVHTAAHACAAIYAARAFAAFNASHIQFGTEWYSVWLWLALVLIEMGLVGFFVGGTLFGLNMLVTCRWLRMNRNDAFSALRIGHFCNFIRLRIQNDEVQVFAIGLNQVPRRNDWQSNPHYKKGTAEEPRWIPTDPLKAHLIETLKVSGASGTTPEA